MEKGTELYIGSASWNYDSWMGPVYSFMRESPHEYLEEYAKKYNCVGIDSWFYRVPDRKEARLYRHAVGSDFLFTCKVPRMISLPYISKQSPGGGLVKNDSFLSPSLMRSFIENAEPILECCGGMILQFEYLNKEKMSGISELLMHLDKFLRHIPKDLPIAIELRNPDFFCPEFFDFIERRNIIPVLSEKQHMPHSYEIFEKFKARLMNAPAVILRLLGYDRQGIEKQTSNVWDEIVQPHDQELASIADMIIEMIRELRVIVNINNHYEGSAPATIDRLYALLESRSGASF